MSETERVHIPEGAGAIGLAAFQLAQKLTAYMIESKLITPINAVILIRNAARDNQEIMDETWAPANEAAGYLLEQFAGVIERAHVQK